MSLSWNQWVILGLRNSIYLKDFLIPTSVFPFDKRTQALFWHWQGSHYLCWESNGWFWLQIVIHYLRKKFTSFDLDLFYHNTLPIQICVYSPTLTNDFDVGNLCANIKDGAIIIRKTRACEHCTSLVEIAIIFILMTASNFVWYRPYMPYKGGNFNPQTLGKCFYFVLCMISRHWFLAKLLPYIA